MSVRPWETNGHQRIQEFSQRHKPTAQDLEVLHGFVRRLEIDPFDIHATRDHVGEHYCRIGPSATVAGSALAAGYRIDAPRRYVEVISFSLI